MQNLWLIRVYFHFTEANFQLGNTNRISWRWWWGVKRRELTLVKRFCNIFLLIPAISFAFYIPVFCVRVFVCFIVFHNRASSCRVWHKSLEERRCIIRPWAQYKSTVAHRAMRTLPPFWCYLWGSSPSCQSAFVSKWSELHEGTAAYRLCTSA